MTSMHHSDVPPSVVPSDRIEVSDSGEISSAMGDPPAARPDRIEVSDKGEIPSVSNIPHLAVSPVMDSNFHSEVSFDDIQRVHDMAVRHKEVKQPSNHVVAFFKSPLTLSLILLACAILIIVMIVNGVRSHWRCPACPPCPQPQPMPISKKEIAVVWNGEKDPEADDTLILTNSQTGDQQTCSAQKLFRESKKVKLSLPGSAPFVAKSVIGKDKHICSVEVNNCIHLGPTASCSLKDDATKGLEAAPSDACS